ncbi:hypothetical protein ACFQGT_16060 [Natrialbaceae archaeon GCM10025810]|uniref:hypothetical protein n=1 Tax=Halovalidus salilacus TaxID=3075124 RepID=UPI0036165022
MGLHFRTATDVFVKTLPFVALRIGIGLLLGAFATVYFGSVGWLGYTLLESGSISELIALGGVVLAVAIFIAAWRMFSRYVLYAVKAAHIAVIAHVVDTGEVPSNQIRFGKDRVAERVVETTVLFGVDQLVKAIVKQLTNAVVSLGSLVAVVPTLRTFVRVVARALGLAANYVDEAIVAYMFTSDEQNPWKAAKDGVVLYGKNWKPVLGSTMLIVIGMYATAFVLLTALAPIASVLADLSPAFEVVGWVVVAGTVLTIYSGVLKPWVKTVVITTFLVESRDDTPDSETADWIAGKSESFRELAGKAESEEPVTADDAHAQAADPRTVS